MRRLTPCTKFRRNQSRVSEDKSKMKMARRESQQKFQENSEARFRTTYRFTAIAVENGVVDLHIRTFASINSTALEVVCHPPGIGAKT
jgi:hypothetical protein